MSDPQDITMITFAAHPDLVPELFALSLTEGRDLTEIINEAVFVYSAINDLQPGIALHVHRHDGSVWRRITVLPDGNLFVFLWRLLRRKAPR